MGVNVCVLRLCSVTSLVCGGGLWTKNEACSSLWLVERERERECVCVCVSVVVCESKREREIVCCAVSALSLWWWPLDKK